MSNEDIKMSDVFDLPMTVGSSQGITGCIDTELGDNNLWLADFFDEDAINDVCKANDMAEAAAHAINNHDPMALRIKELEAENKSLGLKNGDIVVYPECFGDKTLVFIGMAKGLDYSNDCAVICDGNAAPVRLSGLIKVEDK